MSLDPLGIYVDVERVIKKAQQNCGIIESSAISDNDPAGGIYMSLIKETMLQYKLIIKAESHSGYVLTERGRQFRSIAAEDEYAANQRKKLSVDLANAERVYKTYKSTRRMAIFSFIFSALLLIVAFLRLARDLNIWPFHIGAIK